jgi:hypothetical protein
MATIVQEQRKIGDAAVSLSVPFADNEVTVVFNGEQLAQLHGLDGTVDYEANPTDRIKPGQVNLLIISLVNFTGNDSNPAVGPATSRSRPSAARGYSSGRPCYGPSRPRALMR